MGARYAVDEDPLSRLLAPPPNETVEEREVRLRLEAEARQISDRIDDQIKAERAAMKKNKPVKVLLLGQSESGPSLSFPSSPPALALSLISSLLPFPGKSTTLKSESLASFFLTA